MSCNQSATPSGCNFPQTKVDQGPRFERPKMFKKQAKPGRPSNKRKKQYWIK